MEIKTVYYNKSGKDNGTVWSVKLEMPFFGNRTDEFYSSARDILTERARAEGLSVISHLTITYESENESSIFTDILFCRGRELVSLIRMADNRRDGLLIRCPKRGGNNCWYRRGNEYFRCVNEFAPGSVNRSAYKRFLREIPL